VGAFRACAERPEGRQPFVEVSLTAQFRKGSRVITPEGFYDGDGVYKVRFMPDEEGVMEVPDEEQPAPSSKASGAR